MTWPSSATVSPGDPIGGIGLEITAGGDAKLSPNSIQNNYGGSNLNAEVNADEGINATVENATVDGKNVSVINLHVEDDAEGDKKVTVSLTDTDSNGNPVDVGTYEIDANVQPAPKSSKTPWIVSGIVLGSLIIIGVLVKLYLKEAASEAMQMMTP